MDTSLALKWVLAEPYTPEAIALLTDWVNGEVERLAPSWFACEAANVLYRRVLRGELLLEEAQAALQDLMVAVTVRDPEPAIALRAMEIAHALGRPTTYDAQYAALAEREGCELWTADERFWHSARTHYPWVRWVGEIWCWCKGGFPRLANKTTCLTTLPTWQAAVYWYPNQGL